MTIPIQLPGDLEQRLFAEAARSGKTLNDLVVKALDKELPPSLNSDEEDRPWRGLLCLPKRDPIPLFPGTTVSLDALPWRTPNPNMTWHRPDATDG